MQQVTASLSALLRERTAAAHAAAESTPFLLALGQGRVTRAGVSGFLQRLLPVYEALETGRWREDPLVGPLLVPGLERAGRIREDLTALGAPLRADSDAAASYAARVQNATSAPELVAHHYVRYLGDLSGGLVVAAALRRAHGLFLQYLSFPGLRPPAVKRVYREQLDRLPWSAEELERAVAEADAAFAASAALGAELEAEITG